MQAVLGSWKEIANYLGKGVRTVQRWERCNGLPVHRPSGLSKGVVLAFPRELDNWARRQDSRDWIVPTQANIHNIERNSVLASELIGHARLLRTHTAELRKTCEHFVKLSRQRRLAHLEDFSSLLLPKSKSNSSPAA